MKITRLQLFAVCLLYMFVVVSPLDLSVDSSKNQNTVVNINKGWTLEVIKCPEGKIQSGLKLQVNLPTTLHLDLLKNKKIPDPFFGDNYRSLQWVSMCEIKYSKKIEIPKDQLQRNIQLIFHGIDTYAKILYNGVEMLKVNNAFRTYTIPLLDIKDKSKSHEANIEVLISPTEYFDSLGQSKNNMPFKYAQTRKACYQYSWDWAPELNTLGIWRDVQIRFWDNLRFDYVWVRNKILSPQKALLNFAAKMDKYLEEQFLLNQFSLVVKLGSDQLASIKIHSHIMYLDVQINNPKFWWPNGHGQPFIYDFVVQIRKGKNLHDTYKVPYGIRTVELDLSNKQFKIKINGHAIYCKGANYVPLDMLHPRTTNPDFQTEKTYTVDKLFQDAVQSNFNMIRLWGGGQYQTNHFLQTASRKGIMIFYDFMFSDSVYPSTKEFLQNVEEQIKQQVRRTRNYPALAIWSGNNQILQGIQDWGWSSQNYKKDYKLLFETLIKRVIEIQNPDISYIPSSPIYGVGNYGFERGGDFHYWGVWAGGAPFQSYQSAVGPFNSQFGTQALPVWQSIKQFTGEKDRSYDSQVLLTHERHNSQFNTLRNYMGMYVKPSKDFESQVYLSGIVQAMGIQIAIKAQRTGKPKSYGTLYWQFNDAWPAISWAAIDYYGRWKPLQFMAKSIYPNIAIFTQRNGSVVAINDNFNPVQVVAKMFLVSFEGQIVTKQEKTFTLEADIVKQAFIINIGTLRQKLNKVVAYTQIYEKNELKMKSTFFFKKIKQLDLPKSTVSVKQGSSQKQIVVSADKFVKNLFINIPGVRLSDNYFDVVPGFNAIVNILSDHNYKYIKSNAQYISVREASQKQTLSVVYK